MAAGKGINCKYCPELNKSCDGKAEDCLCYKCPRNLGQCLCVRYCRETESVLDGFGESHGDTLAESYEELFKD